jgi:hypothetical protein
VLPAAMRCRARSTAFPEAVSMSAVVGDVTRLEGAGIGDGYRLIVDTSTFHDFDPDQQVAMAVPGIEPLP